MVLTVAVVGAGINGLYCAYFLRKYLLKASTAEHKHFSAAVEIDIYADKFDEHTTSDGAAGIFLPLTDDLGDEPKNFELWNNSFVYYQQLLVLRGGCDHGVFETRCFCFSNSPPAAAHPGVVKNMDVPTACSPISGLYTHFQQLDEEDASKLPPYMAKKLAFKQGCALNTSVIEPRKHMQYMRHQLNDLGCIKFHELHIESFHEVLKLKRYALLVNCTGMGARALCADQNLYSSKGQTVRVYAPFIRESIFHESAEGVETYVIPQHDGEVILGGIFDRDNWLLDVEPRLTASIWSRVDAIIPRLSESVKTGEAREIRAWAGLRPMRRGMQRVELDMLESKEEEGTDNIDDDSHQQTPLIHNYGHGGSGICLAPGSAFQVLKLAQQALNLPVCAFDVVVVPHP